MNSNTVKLYEGHGGINNPYTSTQSHHFANMLSKSARCPMGIEMCEGGHTLSASPSDDTGDFLSPWTAGTGLSVGRISAFKDRRTHAHAPKSCLYSYFAALNVALFLYRKCVNVSYFTSIICDRC